MPYFAKKIQFFTCFFLASRYIHAYIFNGVLLKDVTSTIHVSDMESIACDRFI